MGLAPSLGYTGVFLFELLDEWFKKNWNNIDIDLNRKAWHNALSSEQYYGVLATEVSRPFPWHMQIAHVCACVCVRVCMSACVCMGACAVAVLYPSKRRREGGWRSAGLMRDVVGAQPQRAVVVDGRFDDWAGMPSVDLTGTQAQHFSKIALDARAGTFPSAHPTRRPHTTNVPLISHTDAHTH
jgi:hypothetical protein